MSVVYLFYTEQGDLAVMEDEEETEFIPANGQKRGVKTGTLRGQYNRVPTDARQSKAFQEYFVMHFRIEFRNHPRTGNTTTGLPVQNTFIVKNATL